MEQHPVPRQITTFEFKLIGFMTLKQFLYLLVFIPTGFVVLRVFPIPIVNILLGLITAGIGVAFAFLPYNDRPLDVWVKNMYKRLLAPTQYSYQKHNMPLYFLHNLYFVTDPHKVMAHIESQEKLAEYLNKTRPPAQSNKQKTQIQTLLQKPTAQLRPAPVPVQSKPQPQAVRQGAIQQSAPQQKQNIAYIPQQQTQQVSQPTQSAQHPFFTGIIKNNKQIPLPGVLVYVKDQKNTPLRLLKTNAHGIFATFHPLPAGEYFFEIKDPKGGYIFDTMKVNIGQVNQVPFEFRSKELL